MIVYMVAGEYYADREWLAWRFGLKAETIRKRWQPSTYDEATGAAIYLVDMGKVDTMTAKQRPA